MRLKTQHGETATIDPKVGQLVVHHQPRRPTREVFESGLPLPVDVVTRDELSLSNAELRDAQAEYGQNLNGEGPLADYLSEDQTGLETVSLAELVAEGEFHLYGD